MQADCRRAIAYIAARLSLGRDVGEIYDPGTGAGHIYSGEFGQHAIRVYDYVRSCQLVGCRGALYDSAMRTPIQLCVTGHEFYGYDYACHRRFAGYVTESSVSFFDAAEGRWVLYRHRAGLPRSAAADGS